MANDEKLSFEILKDFGSFGDGKWQKHLTLTKWGDNEPKYDIRPWNEDMTKMGKGITLDDGELFDLLDLIETAFGDESEDDIDDDFIDDDDDDDFDEAPRPLAF